MWREIGSLPTYSFFYIGAMVVHLVICLLLARRLGVRYRIAIVLSVCYQVGMMVGAKVLYDVQHCGLNLPALFTLDHYVKGGLWGGPLAYLALAVPVALLLARRKGAALDLVVLSLPVPMILAKLGCICNGCCYGRSCSMPWAISFPEGGPAPAHTPLHPTQSYEILVLVCILAAFRLLDRPRWRGTMLLWFLCLYGMGRAITEIWRGDKPEDLALGPVSVSQMVCVVTAFVAMVLLGIFHVRTSARQNRDATRLEKLFGDHPRNWRENRYVYPVISRRGGGLSVGVNLNPNQACNFDCIYCQVDRSRPPEVQTMDIEVLHQELEHMVQQVVSGGLFDDPHFRDVPEEFRRFNDIAFSGDGEPTASPQFPAAVRIAVNLRQQYGLDQVKLLLLTNATYLAKPKVRQALAMMDANNGEIWAKLDAGTEDYYQKVNRSNVPLQLILDNILDAARVRPLVIQSLWMTIHDSPPPEIQIDAFAHRLGWIVENGGRLRLVQIHTIARQPAEAFVGPLDLVALQAIAKRVNTIVDVPTEIYSA